MGWALVLSGGAAYGAVQVPVLLELIERLGFPSAVFGTSVGASHAVAVAARQIDMLELMWHDVGADDGASWFQRPNLGLSLDGGIDGPWEGLFSLAPLRRQHQGFGYHRNIQIPAHVGVVDPATQEHRLVHLNPLEDVDRLDAVIASSSQPGIHATARFQGRIYVDGGVSAVVPMVDDPSKYDQIHMVCCSPVGKARKREREQDELRNAWQSAGVAFEMLLSRVVMGDYRRARVYARRSEVFWYAPRSWEEIGSPFDASPADIVQRLQVGQWMAQHAEKIRPFRTQRSRRRSRDAD